MVEEKVMECAESGEGESRDIPEPAAGWTAGGGILTERPTNKTRDELFQ